MKKLICSLTAILFLVFSAELNAQVVKKTKKAITKTAQTVAHKTAQLASTGKAHVTDKVYKGKMAPNGKTVYIDNKSRYYWIDERGHKQYLKKSELKVKVDDDNE